MRKTLGGKISNSFNRRGDYKPGSMSRVEKKAPEPPKFSKEFKGIICNCIDNALKKGKTMEEAISSIAKNERIQVRLLDYYYYMQKIGKELEFDDIIKHIYKEREIEKKLSEKDTESIR